MPSHIYTRLGSWQESIRSNGASAEAARAHAARHHPGATSFEELHALDYLVYAHLQRGDDAEARLLVEHASKVERTFPESDFAAAYALGAIPARYAAERHAWKEAAALPPAGHPMMESFPYDAAHIEFVRALGQLRTGDAQGAGGTLRRLAELREKTTDPRAAYFGQQLDIQSRAIEALLELAEGRTEQALASLRVAADQEDALGKSPVSPGSIYPVRELLGRALLDSGRPADALAAFRRSIELNPGRFNALDGAARAAAAAGLGDEARAHYSRLLEVAAPGASSRPALAEARAYLAKTERSSPGGS